MKIFNLARKYDPEEWVKLARGAGMNYMVRELQPDILVNDRSLLPEDFYTAEQNLRPPKEKGRLWELCMSMNKHWGYFRCQVGG